MGLTTLFCTPTPVFDVYNQIICRPKEEHKDHICHPLSRCHNSPSEPTAEAMLSTIALLEELNRFEYLGLVTLAIFLIVCVVQLIEDLSFVFFSMFHEA